MTVDAAWALAMGWVVRIIQAALLVILAVTLLRHFGVSIPVKGMDHTALAYLAGAYWLIRKAG